MGGRYSEKFSLDKHGKFIAIGAAAMVLLLVLPVVSKPIGELIGSIRDSLAGEKK